MNHHRIIPKLALLAAAILFVTGCNQKKDEAA
jgi:hypothetical protein